MSHPLQREWFDRMKAQHPEWFANKRVLEVGSLDINGSIRHLYAGCEYVGLDVGPGPSVDVVCPVHEFKDEKGFDVVVSANALEHDLHLRDSLRHMVELLRPGGLMFLSIASTGTPKHGTRDTLPQDSPLTVRLPGWCDYYHNVVQEDVRAAIDLDAVFQPGYTLENVGPDLHLFAFKKA